MGRHDDRDAITMVCGSDVRGGVGDDRPSPRGHALMSVQPATLRVAVIDDDSGFLRVLAKRLEGSGYQYRILSGPVPAEELAAMKLNALLVDPALLGPLAWEFLERVCGMLPGLGVIVCTQGATVAQRVRGLRLGADDWISKPCHPEEVMARIEAVVRRHRRGQTREDAGPLVAGELEIGPTGSRRTSAARASSSPAASSSSWSVLAEHAGKVLERDEIYRRVWGYSMIHGDRSVDVFVRKLRSKLQKRSPGLGATSTPTSGSATASIRSRSSAGAELSAAASRRRRGGARAPRGRGR